MGEIIDQVSSDVLKTDRQRRTDFAFVFSMIGSLVISVSSFVGILFAMMGLPYFWGIGNTIIGNYGYLMPGPVESGDIFGNGYYLPEFYAKMEVFELIGLVAGLSVLVLAILMRSRLEYRRAFGVIVLVFSIVSLVGTGGFFIGAFLGITGGILAIHA